MVEVGCHKAPRLRLDMLDEIKHLLLSVIFDDIYNLCVNKSIEGQFLMYKATDSDYHSKVCACNWYRIMYQESVQNPPLEFLLPLTFYEDETGTNALQRYPLEPFMLTLAVIWLHMQEK
jgi:hypothetical protein